MTPDRWAQVRRIFDAALERVPVERAAYLGEVCAGDAGLRGEVETLLASHDASEDFLSEPAADLSPFANIGKSGEYPEGYRIGPYQLQRCIGLGGMGSVWMAARVDHEFEKKVAIKMVKRGMDSLEILRRFRLERQVLAGLDHPNIARLIDGGSTPDGLPYLVMEYVEGTPIDAYCDSRKSTISERLQLFLAVCSAVQYAHQNLVVHRDIKAGNILVTPEGVPKLLDFGIAKLLHNESLESQTWVEHRAMTLEYASPEQVRGDPITTAADVYSLGVLLYRLLTGRSPYSSGSTSPAARQKAICEEEPSRPSTVVLADTQLSIPQATQRLEAPTESRAKARKRLRNKLAGDLDMIILKALRKEPQRRYASVEQFSEDIRRHLTGMPVIARGDTLRYRTAKFARRHAAGVAAAAVIVLALVAGTIVSLYYARQARDERARAERRFDEVRKLARFVLVELDPAIRAGVTPARKLVIGEALDYLSRLQRESGHDLALQREIMNGYFQIGDVQGNLYHANLGDATGAATSYRKGLEMAQSIYLAEPNDTTARRDLARAWLHLGDLQVDRDPTEALNDYTEALTRFEALAAVDRDNLVWQQDVMEAAVQRGWVQFQMGDLKAAVASYTRYLQIAEGLQTIEAAGGKPASATTRRAVARGYDHLGEVLAGTEARDEGLAKLRKALDIYQELFDADRENPAARRSLIAVEQVMGRALLAADRSTEAIDAYHRALSQLDTQLTEDPANRQSQRDVTTVLSSLAEALVRAGRANYARRPTVRALQMLKPLIDLPDASPLDMQQYCWLLVTTPFRDLHNPVAALHYAQKAASIKKDPVILDTLARAQAENRDCAGAVETEHKVLALLPDGSQSDDRKEFETNLAGFRRCAASAANPHATNK